MTLDPPTPAPYSGPLVSSGQLSAAVGSTVVLSGSRLSSVSQLAIRGVIAENLVATEDSLSFTVPDVQTGLADFEITSSFGRLTVQDGIVVTEPKLELRAWTKNLGDGKVRIYAKNVLNAGKVQFLVNGEELAWVRALDESDPKLQTSGGALYWIRTIKLAPGKNAIEVFALGKRVWRAAYSGQN